MEHNRIYFEECDWLKKKKEKKHISNVPQNDEKMLIFVQATSLIFCLFQWLWTHTIKQHTYNSYTSSLMENCHLFSIRWFKTSTQEAWTSLPSTGKQKLVRTRLFWDIIVIKHKDFWHVMKHVWPGLVYGPWAPGPHTVRALQRAAKIRWAAGLLVHIQQADNYCPRLIGEYSVSWPLWLLGRPAWAGLCLLFLVV